MTADQLLDALRTGEGLLRGHRLAVAVTDFGFRFARRRLFLRRR